jgi:hypothetical protein
LLLRVTTCRAPKVQTYYPLSPPADLLREQAQLPFTVDPHASPIAAVLLRDRRTIAPVARRNLRQKWTPRGAVGREHPSAGANARGGGPWRRCISRKGIIVFPLFSYRARFYAGLVETVGAEMRNTSTYVPNLLTPAQVTAFQRIFDEVCAEFGFGPEDRDARDQLADALMALAQSEHQDIADTAKVLKGKATRILYDRGRGPSA